MKIKGNSKLIGVIGWPIHHSKSPLLHNYWLEKYQINAVYIPIPVHPNDIEEAIKTLKKIGFLGINVTIPHKEKLLNIVNIIDLNAKKIGAVNTIVFEEDGKILGKNSDGDGFYQNLIHHVPTYQPSTTKIVIYGAGGAARAIIITLIDRGCKNITIVCRDKNKAQKIIEDFEEPLSWISWDNRSEVLENCTLLINTTQLGMINEMSLEINLEMLPQNAIVYDIIYNPLETPLLKEAKKRNLIAINGLGMLIHQGRIGFESWFNINPEVTPELVNLMEQE
jgi:shikimate dehydrogenase